MTPLGAPFFAASAYHQKLAHQALKYLYRPVKNRRIEEEQSAKRVERSRADVVPLAFMSMESRLSESDEVGGTLSVVASF